MRGIDVQRGHVGGHVSPEDLIPQDHPLRRIREITNTVLEELSPEFERLYIPFGRSSIPPECLLRALLLQVLFTIRSERMLMEQLHYNLLFRWFVGLGVGDKVWVPTVFSKNRDRFLTGEIIDAFFQRVLNFAKAHDLISDDHFTVDGTLIEAWASQKSFRPKDGPTDEQVSDLGEGGRNPSVDFHGEKRSNATHASITDPDARLARKSTGGAYVLAYSGHALMENRNGLVVNTEVTRATGTAECEAATDMIGQVSGTHRITLGADKKYDNDAFVADMRELNVTPHVAQNLKAPGGSAIDGRTTSHEGYKVSIRKRKLVEQIFGWGKTVGMIRKAKMRGLDRVGWILKFNAAAYNLVRMVKLLADATPVPA
jgi:transposase/IS5 family transposase